MPLFQIGQLLLRAIPCAYLSTHTGILNIFLGFKKLPFFLVFRELGVPSEIPATCWQPTKQRPQYIFKGDRR